MTSWVRRTHRTTRHGAHRAARHESSSASRVRVAIRVGGLELLVVAALAAPDHAAAARTTMNLEATYRLETSLHYASARLDVTDTVTIVNRSASAIDASVSE